MQTPAGHFVNWNHACGTWGLTEMIKRVSFTRFRGFERLSAELMPHAFIIGPNSAGKSTILEAIDLAARCLKSVRRIPTGTQVLSSGKRVRALPLPASIDFNDDPVRFDFGTTETRVSVEWMQGGSVHIVWPEEHRGQDANPFFYLEDEGGTQPMSIKTALAAFGTVAVIPVITPLERHEELKNPAYVEQRAASRLASRHFRNHAWLMSRDDTWGGFKDFCQAWLSEISLLDTQFTASANRLAVFYQEPGSRVPKELAWAGDGVQIWVQLLWHVFRATGAGTIVLDEPEVYLHPDLQRRLVRLLESTGAQIVLASHSTDVVTEAPQDGLLWVDRRANGARRLRSRQAIAQLGASLGSSFNLSLARSMRARLVLATDCEDTRILRDLAKVIGAEQLANEALVSLVSVKREAVLLSTAGYAESIRELLSPSTRTAVLLTCALVPGSVRDELTASHSRAGLPSALLSRASLENYLLVPEIIARASGASAVAVATRLHAVCDELEEATKTSMLVAWATTRGTQGFCEQSIAEAEHEEAWSHRQRRPHLAPASRVLEELNNWLEPDGYRPLSFRALARAARPQELDVELFESLLQFDLLVD